LATAAKEAYAKACKTLRVLPEITTPETAQEQPAATNNKKPVHTQDDPKHRRDNQGLIGNVDADRHIISARRKETRKA